MPPTELLEEAKRIAQNTYSDEKFLFSLKYDANQKTFLSLMLQITGSILLNDNDNNHTLSATMNMAQLAFIKRLDCIERVMANVKDSFSENRAAEFHKIEFAEKDATLLEDSSAEVAIAPRNIQAAAEKSAILVDEVDESVVAENNDIAVACVDGSSSSCCCPTNTSMSTATTISDASYTNGRICCPCSEQWFKFTATKTGQYTIYTIGSLDTIGTLYDCCGNQMVEVDDYDSCGTLNFRIIRNLCAGCIYYVKVRAFGENTGSYGLKVTDNVIANYVNISQNSITLEQGVLYELPIAPNYSYKGFNGAVPIPGLSVSINPSNASEQKIWWWEQYGDVLECSYGWDNDGDRYIHVTATGVGSAKLYAQDWKENGERDECMINVNSTDPFHPSNIEYVRIKKWRSVKTTNGVNYTECDMSTIATKSNIDDLTYFTVLFPDEDEITTFEINQALINQLNNIEEQYQSQFFKNGRPLCFHKGKEYADAFASEGKIEYASAEYYGIWAYNGNSVCNINDRLSFIFALATIAYSGFMYGFTKIVSMQSMQMTTGQTKTYTNSQYMDAVESQKAIADISDDIAIQTGKTDVISTSNGRRTWRASEMKVAESYPTSSGFKYNKSYKIINGDLIEVPHGTAGSQRPDFYNPSTNHIIEVKNYTITTQTGRNSLANNIVVQYNNRKIMFPNANIEFIVDVAGQSYTQNMLDNIIDLVSTSTGEDMVYFIFN